LLFELLFTSLLAALLLYGAVELADEPVDELELSEEDWAHATPTTAAMAAEAAVTMSLVCKLRIWILLVSERSRSMRGQDTRSSNADAMRVKKRCGGGADSALRSACTEDDRGRHAPESIWCPDVADATWRRVRLRMRARQAITVEQSLPPHVRALENSTCCRDHAQQRSSACATVRSLRACRLQPANAEFLDGDDP
jgi:hypothetical protein